MSTEKESENVNKGNKVESLRQSLSSLDIDIINNAQLVQNKYRSRILKISVVVIISYVI
jgi:hypothetical protein